MRYYQHRYEIKKITVIVKLLKQDFRSRILENLLLIFSDFVVNFPKVNHIHQNVRSIFDIEIEIFSKTF